MPSCYFTIVQLNKVKYRVLTIAIAIVLLMSVLSFIMVSLLGFYTEEPTTPAGTVNSVTITTDAKISVGFGIVTPQTEYLFCGVILIPPGSAGGESSSQARLWKIADESFGFDYNNSIRLEIAPPDPYELVGIDTNQGTVNDFLVINCSAMGKVPEGKWILYLIYIPTTRLIAGAAWEINETTFSDRSLSFSRMGWPEHADPMEEYGFAHPPQPWEMGSGPFWLTVMIISASMFFALIVVLAIAIILDTKKAGKDG